MLAPLRHRRWFRLAFSLRTLFVAVTALCLFLGWQVHFVQERKAVLAEAQRIDPVHFRYISTASFEAEPDNLSLDEFLTEVGYARIPRIRRLLGDRSCILLELPPSIDTEWLARAENAFPEAQLFVYGYKQGEFFQYRDSLYKPSCFRKPNQGTLFQTGLRE